MLRMPTFELLQRIMLPGLLTPGILALTASHLPADYAEDCGEYERAVLP
jgi:hypothetical protein